MSASHTTCRGWPALELRTPTSRALILEHGAHIVSWVARGREQLYLSPVTEFAEERPIRGGIPICFSQFDILGTLPKQGSHGPSPGMSILSIRMPMFPVRR